MKKYSSVSVHKKRIRIEGFHPEKFLSKCADCGIVFQDIRFSQDLEITVVILNRDYSQLLGIAKRGYRVTVIEEIGVKPAAIQFLNKKSMVVGILLLILFFYLQGLFISEIRIYGYEQSQESFVREKLREQGVYEGARKNFDPKSVKNNLFAALGNVSWIGLELDGNLLTVNVVEVKSPKKKVSILTPCNIVSQKYGKVEKIIAKNGIPQMPKDTYIQPGQIGISGTYPLENKGNELGEKSDKERYVHAEGEIIAFVPYHYTFYQEKYELLKKPTGKKMYGIHVKLGKFEFNTVDAFTKWESWVYNEKNIVNIDSVFPFCFSLAKGEEVTLLKKEREEKEILEASNRILREKMKTNIPENTELVKKSLKFEPKVNIIEVRAMIQVRENIGAEEEIIIGKPQ